MALPGDPPISDLHRPYGHVIAPFIGVEQELLSLLRELAEEQRQCREYLGRLVALAEERQAADRALAQVLSDSREEAMPTNGTRPIEDYRDTVAGFEVLVGGAWLRATPQEESEIAQRIGWARR